MSTPGLGQMKSEADVTRTRNLERNVEAILEVDDIKYIRRNHSTVILNPTDESGDGSQIRPFRPFQEMASHDLPPILIQLKFRKFLDQVGSSRFGSVKILLGRLS